MEEEPSRPFLVLGDIVQDFAYVDRKAFRIVECGRKEAYGCGPNGDAIVRGLALFMRLGGDDQDPYSNPKLCLGAIDEVFDRVGSEIDDRRAKLYGRHLRLTCRIYTVDGDVMVLRVTFFASFSSTAFRTYYLLYDSAAASLSLIPGLPPCCRSVYTEFPLKVKVGEEDKYSLVLMAERSVSSTGKYTEPVLCQWSPPPSPDENRPDYSKCAWDLKARVRVNAAIAVADTLDAEPFKADVSFSFKGHAVWGDLSQGILYCDSSDLVDDTEPVDFKHVMLPDECRTTDDDSFDFDRDQNPVYRTIGGVGDSVWLVVIEPSFTCPGDTTMKVWTLDLLSVDEEKKWNLHREFKMQSVWELGGFRAQGLPRDVPKFPILRQQQDDCALYLFLPEPYTAGLGHAHLMCIGLSSSSCEVLSNRRLAIPLMDKPVFVDSDFFDQLHMVVS